jgi:hypothetical protein
MAILKEWPTWATQRSPGRYDWDLYLDGQIHKLVHGEDFDSRSDTICGLARDNARARGIGVRVGINGSKETGDVAIQAVHEQDVA